MTRLASILIVIAAVTAADAKPKTNRSTVGTKGTVKAHMDRAAKAHKAGKFKVALEELEAAYAIDPQPKLEFAIAQVQQKLAQCDDAIGHYEKFLATIKDKAKQAVVEQAIDACKKKLAKEDEKDDKVAISDDKNKPDGGVFRKSKPPADQLPTTGAKPAVEAKPAIEATPAVETKPAVAPTPAVETAKPPKDELPPLPPEPMPAKPATPPPAAEPRVENAAPIASVSAQPAPAKHHWYNDPLGDALVVTGIAAAVGSVIMYRGAQSDLDKAEAAQNLTGYRDYHDQAEKKQLYTFVLGGAGIALISAGVIRYALHDRHKEAAGVALVPGNGGGLVTWSGGF